MSFSTGLQIPLSGHSPHLSTKVHKRGRADSAHALHRRSMVTLIGWKTHAWELVSKLCDTEVIRSPLPNGHRARAKSGR
jgi:hypothetical protein